MRTLKTFNKERIRSPIKLSGEINSFLWKTKCTMSQTSQKSFFYNFGFSKAIFVNFQRSYKLEL